MRSSRRTTRKRLTGRPPYAADRISPRGRCPRRIREQQEEMGLYERLLEERCRGRFVGILYGSDSPALDTRLADAPKDRPPRYRGDLHLLHRYINEGVRGQGAAMRFASLKARYPEPYAEYAAETRGQGELP
jgi:hypothetical protein